MKNKLNILIFLFILTSIPANALEEAAPLVLTNLEELNLKNPFKSQLPPPVVTAPDNKTSKPQNRALPSGTPTLPDGSFSSPAEDPLRSMVAGLSVTGVVWNSARPQAIINGQVISQGDSFMQFKVTQIKKEQIVLTAEDQQYFITP